MIFTMGLPLISTQPQMESFTYNHIDLERPAFRLLRLFKGGGSDISGELFQAWLQQRGEAISYEALSYTWGSPEITRSIEVDGRRLGVTRNLYLALQHLRYQDQDRILWVDAICIDQSNLKERGHQVQQMGEMYKQADRVIFWLGPATYVTNVVMDSLRQLQEESVNIMCRDWKRTDQRWAELWTTIQPYLRTRHSGLEALQREGLQSLLSQRWFKRVWILQEVANAQTALVCCGWKSVQARFFALAPLLMDVKPDSHCQAVLDIMPGPSRKDSWWNQSRDLCTLLLKFGRSEAHDSRDMIYALLGMSSDANNSDVIHPDYGKSEEDLVCSVFRFFCCDVDLPKWRQPSTIQKLLETLTSYVEMQGGNWMPLFWAVANNLEAIVERLLNKNSYFGAKDTEGRMSLLRAVQKRRWAIVKLLLEKGAKINAKDIEGQTLLLWDAAGKSWKIFELLLENSATSETMPILGAAKNRSTAIVKMLLEKGANIGATDIEGQTLLPWAIRTRHDAILELLLEKGVNIEGNATGQTALLQAVGTDNWPIVKLLLEKGANTEAKDGNNQTPLLLAVLRRNTAIVEALLEKGANTEAKDGNNQTPLFRAVRMRELPIVKLLLKKGANTEAKDQHGGTPLHWAVQSKNWPMVELLRCEG
jgi:ankyrin repeat protein